MHQDTRRASPSKREIAFRFVACTTIALALYYTPDIRWGPAAPDARTAPIDAFLLRRIAEAPESCAYDGNVPRLIDAVAPGN